MEYIVTTIRVKIRIVTVKQLLQMENTVVVMTHQRKSQQLLRNILLQRNIHLKHPQVLKHPAKRNLL